jgi:WD40 repeat protein
LLLKYETYGDSQEEIVIHSMTVVEVHYNLPLPDDLFFPPTSGYLLFIGGRILDEGQLFSSNNGIFTLRPTPRAQLAPPPSFDPAQNPIVLQFPVSPSAGVSTNTPAYPRYLEFQEVPSWEGDRNTMDKIQVYAGPYHLGDLELESTIFTACQRSPDGKAVALLTSKDRSRSKLTWFDLSSLEIHIVTELAGGSTEFAFSPDSRKLAFANCRMSCGVSILDLESQEVTRLGPIYDWISYLEWSPDGESLAFMTFRGALRPRIHVTDLETGLEIHVAEYDFDAGRITTPGSPVESWEAAYPPVQAEVGCMLP